MLVNDISASMAKLTNMQRLNIIMGRNGSGKSRFLRQIETSLYTNTNFYIRYISPERAGSFARDGNIITNMSTMPTFIRDSRAVNQAVNFKAASAVLLRDAETIYLRRLQASPQIRQDLGRSFTSDRLRRINSLLLNIELVSGENDFEFRSLDGAEIKPASISSGESEAVSLASEVIYFFLRHLRVIK